MSVVASATDYDVLQRRATMFYDQEEWLSASAMYTLMIDQRPQVVDTYSRAIISAAMRNDTLMQTDLLEKSFQNHIPFDSLYSHVKTLSFDLGKTDLYENFLLRTQMSYPWLSRNIDSQLLKYYSFRRNGTKMEEYALKMLNGIENKPESIPFREILADAYLLQGEKNKAIETYNSILKLDANNYDTLIELGNCYYSAFIDDNSDSESKKLAIEHLLKANSIKPTPFVTKILSELQPPTK